MQREIYELNDRIRELEKMLPNKRQKTNGDTGEDTTNPTTPVTTKC